MKRTVMLFFVVALAAPNVCFSQQQQTTPGSHEKSKSTEQFVSDIDKKIPQLLRDFAVPGAAIGIIDDGEIVLQKGYGFADVEKGTRVTTKTGFNIGSISKTFAAWGIMKLVEEGKLDLDAPAEQYLSRWKFPESKFDSRKVTIRRMLSHTAGLSLHGYPGWSPQDKLPTIEESLNGKNNGPGRVEIIMEPGTQLKYSGGGYTVMQLIIEEVTGQKFEDYMQAQVLDALGMTGSSYKIDDKIMAASASEYDSYGEATDFELFTAQAAAGLHTTIEDFTRFALANLHQHRDFKGRNPVLLAKTIKQMMKPSPQGRGRYGYGMGYFVESIPGTSIALAGHRGANTGWHAMFTVNPKTNDGFVMVTNGGSGQKVYASMLYDWMLWETGVKLEDWHTAKPVVAKKLKSIIDSQGIGDIATAYKELKENQPDKYDFSERQMNELGYYYMGKEDFEKAAAIFKLNVEAFPNSGNVYDSYGEVLLKQGHRVEAIKNYKQSVELVPQNENGIKVLNDLGVSTAGLVPFDTGPLQQGSQGPGVSALQTALNSKLDPSPGLAVDGLFGPATEAAVKQLQKQAQIPVNGVVSREATAALKELGADVDPYFRESSVTSSQSGPQVITRNVLQDSKGVFWLATWHGVLQFDGTNFTNVTNKEGLRRYRAFSLLEDHQKNIWVGTVGAGVYRYDPSATLSTGEKTWTNFTTKDGLVDNSIVSIMQDRDDNIWIGSKGVSKYDGKSFTSFTKEDNFTSSDVNSISQAPDGTIWFGTRGALFHYDGESFVNFTKKHGLNFPGYVPTLIDREGQLWFSGENGVYHYDGDKVQHLFKPASYSLFEDSQGNIWFSGGTLKGENSKPGTVVLNRFDPARGLENILDAREPIEIESGAIFGLTEDKDGNIWFGAGSGIGRIDGDTVHYY